MILALEEEARPFLESCRARPDGTVRATGRGAYVATVGSHEFDVAVTGPGYANVLECLAAAEPSEVIHAGFAGAIRDDIQPLSVFRTACVRRGAEVIDVAPPSRPAFANLDAATIVTAPGVMRAVDKQRMRDDEAGDLVDMETHAAAVCCREEGVPYAGIRVVTDAVDDDLPPVVRASFDGRRFRRWPIVRRALLDRAVRRELMSLRRRSEAAARVLAATLLAGLTEPAGD